MNGFVLLPVPYYSVHVMLGGWPAPVLSERSEFSGASIFLVRFFAMEKMNNVMGKVLFLSPSYQVEFE